MGKIIFVNRYFYPDLSATSQMLSDLTFGLNLDGLEIHVVTSRQRYDDVNAVLCPRETIKKVHVHRIWTSRFGRQNLLGRTADYLSFYVSAVFCLYRLTKRNDVIVAKTDPPLISIVAGFVAWAKSARLINWLQDLFPEVAKELGVKVIRGPLYWLLKYLRNLTLFAAERNIVIGQLMGERLVKEGVAKEKISLIPNWADGDIIHPVERNRNSLRRKWGLDEKFVVGYSGNLGRGHDFSTILDAAKLLQGHVDIVFLFIGGGAQLSLVKQKVAEEGLSNVVFQPYQPREQLSESLSVPDVHLISLKPSLEGLIVPSKFYGIIAAGRPSIFIGDTEGEIARILVKNQCGIAIQHGDGEKLAQQLLQLEKAGKIDSSIFDPYVIRKIFNDSFNFYLSLNEWKKLLYH